MRHYFDAVMNWKKTDTISIRHYFDAPLYPWWENALVKESRVSGGWGIKRDPGTWSIGKRIRLPSNALGLRVELNPCFLSKSIFNSTFELWIRNLLKIPLFQCVFFKFKIVVAPITRRVTGRISPGSHYYLWSASISQVQAQRYAFSVLRFFCCAGGAAIFFLIISGWCCQPVFFFSEIVRFLEILFNIIKNSSKIFIFFSKSWKISRLPSKSLIILCKKKKVKNNTAADDRELPALKQFCN